MSTAQQPQHTTKQNQPQCPRWITHKHQLLQTTTAYLRDTRQPTNPTTATSAAAVEYPTATANYGTVVAVGILDASSGGNLLAYANLTASKVVSTGDVFRFDAGDIDITLA